MLTSQGVLLCLWCIDDTVSRCMYYWLFIRVTGFCKWYLKDAEDKNLVCSCFGKYLTLSSWDEITNIFVCKQVIHVHLIFSGANNICSLHKTNSTISIINCIFFTNSPCNKISIRRTICEDFSTAEKKKREKNDKSSQTLALLHTAETETQMKTKILSAFSSASQIIHQLSRFHPKY